MPRGGRRQGTPGKAYSNRTDLGVDYSAGSPASGGMVTQQDITQQAAQAAAPQPASAAMAPEDTPMLLDPTGRPDEPVTTGLPGGGEAAFGVQQQAAREAERFKPWLPLLMERANSGDASPSFVMFVKRLRGM